MNALGAGAALVAGFAGSAHCGVMCGGIATALGSRGTSPGAGAAARGALGFNLGRLLGYAVVGATLEVVVQRLGGMVPGNGYAGGLRIVAAVWMAALAWRLLSRRDLLWIGRLGAWFWRRIAPLAAPAMRLPGPLRTLAMGALWGFMPCGLVYSVLLVAASSSSVAGAVAVMLAFGAGTMPAMLGITLGGTLGLAGLARRPQLRRAAGAVVLACGLVTAWGGVSGLVGPRHLLGMTFCSDPVRAP